MVVRPFLRDRQNIILYFAILGSTGRNKRNSRNTARGLLCVFPAFFDIVGKNRGKLSVRVKRDGLAAIGIYARRSLLLYDKKITAAISNTAAAMTTV